MHRLAPVALATLIAATAPALVQAHPQAPPAPAHFSDPANLAGERVRPRDGRELPIDGGDGNNALGLAQMLRKLNTRASLMLIVAHPDDEDGGMLTYYSRGLGARVAVLTLTRGEGGQNAMTGDFEDALGLLRTQELLSADRYMGVDQFFGTEVDFGFSKTKDEAFAKWGHDRVLYDAVRAVRIYRPLVIAAVFSGAVTDGHGQHQVSGQIAQEVFKAAGDPSVFPELTREGILPWQPLKVYARVPFSRVTAQGLYDYATGQTVPAQFTDYVTGQTFTTAPTPDVTINEGQTDPLLTWSAADPADLRSKPSNLNEPISYVQFARIGLGLQRSQIGPGVRNAPAGRVDVSYHLYGSRVCAPNLPNPTPKLCSSGEGAPYNPALANQPTFFDGIDTSTLSIASLAPDAPEFVRFQLARMVEKINSAATAFDPRNTGATTAALANALQTCDALIGLTTSVAFDRTEKENVLHELKIKRAQLNDALAFALGLSLDATTNRTDLAQGETATVALTLTETSTEPVVVTFSGVKGDGAEQQPQTAPQLSPEHPLHGTRSIKTLDVAPITKPYFYRKSIEQPVYDLSDPRLRNAPQTPAPYDAEVTINYQGSTVRLERIVHSGPQPVSVIPPVSISFDSRANVVPLLIRAFRTDIHVENVRNSPLSGSLTLAAPVGWSLTRREIALNDVPSLKAVSSPIGIDAQSIHVTSTPARTGIYATLSIAGDSGQRYTEGFRAVGYGTLPRTNYYTPATLRVVPVDLKLPPPDKRRVGYLPGTGDDVPAALASIGLTPTILKVSDLTADKLKAFDTVILGVRTYNAHPDLHGAPTQALFDFARSGGNVVVQYQTNEFSAADAPYPLELHGERVIDETVPVKLLDPNSPLLTTPNKITAADFNNWIEERGHGFLDSWDPHYTALTETHDPGSPSEHIADQEPQRGALITTQLGKGRWTYCAFALYRQLPEAVPGAFRIFANLLNP